jgi:hypothetical protein
MEEIGIWRKASYSATNGNCVEVADAAGGVQVRDTTDRTGAVLAVSTDAWQRFTATIKLAETQHKRARARSDRARFRPRTLM